MKPRYHSAKTILAPLNAMRSKGISVAQALTGTGLSLSILNRPEQHVHLSQELVFLRNLRKVSKDPMIGLKVGACYPLSLFGIYGYALMSAQNVGEAMRLAYQFVELSFAFYEHEFSAENHVLFMKMHAQEYAEEDIPMLNEREVMATMMILRGLLGDDFAPLKVQFSHPPQGRKSIYRGLLNCAVEFDCDSNNIQLPMSVLETPLLQCDSDTAALCIDRCERLKARLDEEVSIVDEVRERLLLRPGYFPNIESLAAQLNISGRTLRRRLAEKNTGYQQIVDQIRYELAREYLSGTDIGIEQISALLGYSDPAHFSHAFRRWSGSSPSCFRGL